MKRSWWLILSVVAALAGTFLYVNSSDQPQSDEEQIRALLAVGESSIERRSVRDAMACVSEDYSDESGFNRDALRLQLIQALRTAERYDVSLQTESLAVSRDSAEVETVVALHAYQEGRMSMVFHGPVRIMLKKEPARRYLVLASSAWKVVRITGLPMGPE